MNMSELPSNLKQLKATDWKSKPVKEEIRGNLLKALKNNLPLFAGIIGYENTVLPSLQIALLASHDILFLGEKGQAKSRLMRSLIQFLDEYIPYIDHPSIPVHEDPYNPITTAGKKFLAQHSDDQIPIGWWKREDRYAERLAPGTKFADIIGEIDPGKLVSGVSMANEDALAFGLIPRMHRGIFAMNEIPELDELVQVGLFNVLEERDVQIRGYPIKFDIDIFVLFSANPSTYNRSGKVIPQLKDRIGSLIQTHYPLDRDGGIEIMEQEAGNVEDKEFPVAIPRFMKEIVEQISRSARKSKFIDQQSGVSARFSIANYKTMIASARRRCVCLNEANAVPRISDLSHLASSSLGKLELDLMGSHQMSEKQILDSLIADAVKVVFQEYVDAGGLEEISQVFGKGVKIEVGDMLPSTHYAERIKVIPKAWEKTFEVNPSENDAVRASCIEFVLAGLHASDKISRSSKHGRISYELR